MAKEVLYCTQSFNMAAHSVAAVSILPILIQVVQRAM